MAKKNPVARTINTFNRPATHRDRKKDMKRGATKHKRSNASDLNCHTGQRHK